MPELKLFSSDSVDFNDEENKEALDKLVDEGYLLGVENKYTFTSPLYLHWFKENFPLP